MRAVRLGSYSMWATLAGTPSLSWRRKADQPVGPLVAATLVPGGDAAVHVPATLGVQRPDQRLLRLVPGDLGKVGAAGTSPTGRGRLVLTDSHESSNPLSPALPLPDRAAEDVNPVALGEGDDRPLGVRPLAPADPGPAALALAVDRVDPGHLDAEDFFDGQADLGLVGVRCHDEGVLALVEQAVALLRDDRPQENVPR